MKIDIFLPLRKIVRFFLEGLNNFAYPKNKEVERALKQLNKTLSTREHTDRLVEEFEKAAAFVGKNDTDQLDHGNCGPGCGCK